MKQSLVKFDDLAFILLFFFMIIAVVSFSESAQSKSDFESKDMESVAVFLSEDGRVFKEGIVVEPSSFSGCEALDLSCSLQCSWETVSAAISELSLYAGSVTLVV